MAKTIQKFTKLGILAPLVVFLLTLPVVVKLFRPGFFPMQDDLQAFRVHQMDKCFDDLQIPCRWVPDAGYQYGYPQFNYYPPLPYYLGALLHRVGFQYIDAVKILFILGYVSSALAMYLLVSSFIGPWSGLIAGVLYTYVPYKAVEVYVRGALNEFWALTFFPVVFWGIYKLIKTGKLKYLIWLAVSIGALISTHSLTTMIFAPFAVCWAVYWLYTEKWKNFPKIIWGGILGFGLSAFYFLPVIFERKFAHIESLLSGYFDYRQHFVSLYKLFVSMEWGYGSSGFPDEKLNLSIGVVAWIVGLIIVPVTAIVRLKKEKKLSILALLLSALAIVSIFMMHLKSSFIWAKLPFMWYLQFPWRFLGISMFLLSILAGFAVYFSGKFKYILGVILISLSIYLYLPFFVPKDWLDITDSEKFSGQSWEKQLTISIFDYLPIYGTLPPWSKAPEFPEVLEGKVKFLDYQKGSNFQKGVAEASEDSLIRIPLFDFPGMQVRVDGQRVTHKNNDCRNERYCRGLITFNVPSGRHEIFVKLYDTPVRKIGNILTMISLGVVSVLMLKSKR